MAKMSKDSVERGRSEDLASMSRRAERREEELNAMITQMETRNGRTSQNYGKNVVFFENFKCYQATTESLLQKFCDNAKTRDFTRARPTSRSFMKNIFLDRQKFIGNGLLNVVGNKDFKWISS